MGANHVAIRGGYRYANVAQCVWRPDGEAWKLLKMEIDRVTAGPRKSGIKASASFEGKGNQVANIAKKPSGTDLAAKGSH